MAVEGGSKPKKPSTTIPDDKKSAFKKRKRNDDASAAAEPPATHPLSAKSGVPVASTAEEARMDDVPTHKKRRRHKRTGEQQEPLDPQEAARRRRQRELQELALKLRTEGKEYMAAKKGAKKRSSDGGQQGQQATKDREGRKGRHYLGDKTPGWRPFDAVDVIVLPIYWNNNKEEKAAVLTASERARDILASGGIGVDMDASNKYTPGQKMKYWETMGVRVRVELGPRDVANGNCVVAVSTRSPGEVATKNVVNMRHKMLDAVRAALEKVKSGGQQRLEEGDEEVGGAEPERDVDDDDERQPKFSKGQQEKRNNDAKKSSGKKQKTEVAAKEEDDLASSGEEEEEQEGTVGNSDDEDAEGAATAAVELGKDGVLQDNSNPEARKPKQQRNQERDTGRGSTWGAVDERQEGRAAQSKAGDQSGAKDVVKAGSNAPHSADALEDDFGSVLEFEAEEDKLTLSKKDRLKKASKLAKAKRKAERFAEMGGSEDPDGAQVEVADKEGYVGNSTGKRRPKMVTF